jgi:hypothetical protein
MFSGTFFCTSFLNRNFLGGVFHTVRAVLGFPIKDPGEEKIVS